MASICRSAASIAARYPAFRSAPQLSRHASSRRTAAMIARSIAPALLGSMESMMPLHNAIASARLKSYIAVDSRCWSWLSQGRALPL